MTTVSLKRITQLEAWVNKLEEQIVNHDCHKSLAAEDGCQCDAWIQELRAKERELTELEALLK